MPKQIYCAACGLELHQLKKVVRQEIFNFVEPHGCIDPAELPPIKERDLTIKNVDQHLMGPRLVALYGEGRERRFRRLRCIGRRLQTGFGFNILIHDSSFVGPELTLEAKPCTMS